MEPGLITTSRGIKCRRPPAGGGRDVLRECEKAVVLAADAGIGRREGAVRGDGPPLSSGTVRRLDILHQWDDDYADASGPSTEILRVHVAALTAEALMVRTPGNFGI